MDRLDQMRERLTSLSDEARSIRSQVPDEFHPDVERIQQQMQRLGERLSELSGGALVMAAGGGQRGQRPLDDARRADPGEVIRLGGPRKADDPWDQESANALTRFYESGAAYSETEQRTEEAKARSGRYVSDTRMIAHQPQANASRGEEQATRGVEASWLDERFGEIARRIEEQKTRSVEPAWLDERFGEIARRIEEALAEIHPENSLLNIGQRFELLEARMSAVLSNVATKGDLKELRVAEAQIEDIGKQLGQLRRQLERLDAIDAHLGTLTEQLSDEHFVRILNQSSGHDSGRLQAIDDQLASIGKQLAHDRLVESATGREAMEAHSRDLGEVRGLIENLIHERRHHDENNASMLETMQQAIIRVLDRIDALELQAASETTETAASASASVAPATTLGGMAEAMKSITEPPPLYSTQQTANSGFMSLGAGSGSASSSAAPKAATPLAAMEKTAPPSAMAAPAPAAPEPAPVPAAPAPVMQAKEPPKLPDMTLSSAPASDFEYQVPRSSIFARNEEETAEATQSPFAIAPFSMDDAFARDMGKGSGKGNQPKAIDPQRHDFIADAHRAKLKAAAKLDSASASDQAKAGAIGAALDKSVDQIKAGTIKPRPRRSFFNLRSPRALMGILTLLAMIPAALFFMPRDRAKVAAPATTNALPYYDGAAKGTGKTGSRDVTVPSLPGDGEILGPGDVLPRKQSQRLEALPPPAPGTYQDASKPGPVTDYEHIDTASLGNDSIALASGVQATARQVAENAAPEPTIAANVTPMERMQEHLLRANGGAAAGASGSLPSAMVGPYSLRLAAAQGDASAQFEVASRLAEGKGADKDMSEAVAWFQRSAEGGFAMAQFRLGTIYERGIGVTRDLTRAQMWYTRSAEQGNVKAMHNLAVMIAGGSGGEPNYELAARWFGEAAVRGLPDSQFNLAVLYENGLGVKKNRTEAYKWLLLSARSGDEQSKARRDALKAELSAADRKAGETLADSWRVMQSDPVANDFRAAGQAWQTGGGGFAGRG